jgi:hypothetical protein
MPVDGTIRPMLVGALLAATLAVGGCSTQIADIPVGGLPADAPPRPKEAGSYPPVHDFPPEREAAMKPDEQKRIQSELIAARDRQAASGTPPQNPPAK